MRWAEAAAFGGGHLQACSSPPPTQGPKGTAVIVGYAFAFPHLGDAPVGSLGVIPLVWTVLLAGGAAPEVRWRQPAMLAGMCCPARWQATSSRSVATNVILCPVCPDLLVLQSAALGSPSGAHKGFSVWSCISACRAPQGAGQVRVRLSCGRSPTAAALLLVTPFSSSLVLERRGEPSQFLGFESQEIK